MNRFVLMTLFLAFVVSCGWALEASTIEEQKVLTVSSTCNVDANLTSKIQEHVSFNLGTNFRMGKCVDVDSEIFDDIARAAYESMQPQDLYGLVLYDLPTNIVNVTIYTITNQLAVINLERLRRGTPLLNDDDERFIRRVKKESMRALGALIGVPKCPTYTCAMYAHGIDTNSLDRKGYNFCPPHRIGSDRLLIDAGLDVTKVIDQAIEMHERERQKKLASEKANGD